MLVRIDSKNCKIFDQLVQDYEHEFSLLTRKQKNKLGAYDLDSTWNLPYRGYYWSKKGEYIGFVIFKIDDRIGNIAEFYIIPSHRRHGFGEQMAHQTFDLHCGQWQVKQIEGK